MDSKTARLNSLKKQMKKGSGFLVKTKHGKGKTYHSEGVINKKLPVHLENGVNMLIGLENVEIIGYTD